MTVPSGEFVYSPKLRQSSIVRRWLSRYSTQEIGLHISGPAGDIDPDPGTMTLKIYVEDNFDDSNPEGSLVITATVTPGEIQKDGVGLYSFRLQPEFTQNVALLKAIWEYKVNNATFKYQDFFQTMDPQPVYEGLKDEQKLVVEQITWQLGDLFDSTVGGPHLVEEFQTHFDNNRLAQLLYITVNKLNVMSQPLTHFTVGPLGTSWPLQYMGILQWGLYLEVLRHFMRTYTEQPNMLGGPGVAYLDRRDYAQRWKAILDEEMPQFIHAVRMFKRKQLGLGSGALLVSGGIFGRNWFMLSSYSAQTRSMRFMYPMSWVGVTNVPM